MAKHANDGKELEESTYQLLKAAGKRRMEREVFIGSKKCDLYFESGDAGFVYRTAVECKDYKSPLTKTQVTSILMEYADLMVGKIDRLLIVTRNGLNAPATRKILDLPYVSHQTFAELQSQLIDFKSYVELQSESFAEVGEGKLYIPCIGKLQEGERISDLHKYLKSELISGKQPIALIGGYGTGKSTTSRNLFQDFAREYVGGSSDLVPIYVPLSKLTHEQSLEGLLGSLFTASFPINGYSFPLFKNHNDNGTLVLFLDGFDEMRHRLSWEEFVRILTNLQKLTDTNARVVFAGRPTAFLNEDEYEAAILGNHTGIATDEVRFTKFKEVFIEGFDEPAIFKYVRELAEATNAPEFDYHKENKFYEAYYGKGNVADLARRPVQLDMICQVLPAIEGGADTLSAAMVFDLFVNHLIERDLRKDSRKGFGKKKRRSFAGDIAWWLWNNKSYMQSATKDIPDAIMSKYMGPVDDAEEVLRNLIVGSFLSSRRGEYVFFPHRSIQEYLVAETLLEKAAFEPTSAIEFLSSSACTDEVEAFSVELFGEEAVKAERKLLSDKRSLGIPAFGTKEFIDQITPLHKELSNLEGEIGQRLARVSAPNFQALSNLYNVGRRQKGLMHMVVGAHWLAYYCRENDEMKIVSEALIDDLFNRIEPSSWSFFILSVISAVLSSDVHLRRFLLQFGEEKINGININKLRYNERSQSVNISAVYKDIAEEVKATGVIEKWTIGDSFKLDGFTLPRQIEDTGKEVWAKVWGVKTKSRRKEKGTASLPSSRR